MAKSSLQPGWGTHLTAWWPADPTAYGSARERRGGRYEPFVPPHIATWRFQLTDATAAAVSQGAAELHSLGADGGTPGGVHSLAETLLRSESVASSRIEGLQMTHARIARARHGDVEDKTARDVLANIAAMREAIDLGASADHVSVDAIRRIHKQLLPEDLDNDGQPIGGRMRTTQNWIGRSDVSPVGATFVPPPPEYVDELLADLGDFIDRTDLAAIAQAAIAHAQFETIHPFMDGNGRTGRALVYSILRRRHELAEYVPPISLVLGGMPSNYVGALTAYREGNYNQIVELYAVATEKACAEAERLGAQVDTLRAKWEQQLPPMRSHATARALLDVLPAAPVLDANDAAARTGRSLVSARRALEQLTELGILKPLNARKWGRAWEAPELFELVTAFERRAGNARVELRAAATARTAASATVRAEAGTR
jgi:Fic family protein